MITMWIYLIFCLAASSFSVVRIVRWLKNGVVSEFGDSYSWESSPGWFVLFVFGQVVMICFYVFIAYMNGVHPYLHPRA